MIKLILWYWPRKKSKKLNNNKKKKKRKRSVLDFSAFQVPPVQTLKNVSWTGSCQKSVITTSSDLPWTERKEWPWSSRSLWHSSSAWWGQNLRIKMSGNRLTFWFVSSCSPNTLPISTFLHFIVKRPVHKVWPVFVFGAITWALRLVSSYDLQGCTHQAKTQCNIHIFLWACFASGNWICCCILNKLNSIFCLGSGWLFDLHDSLQ